MRLENRKPLLEALTNPGAALNVYCEVAGPVG